MPQRGSSPKPDVLNYLDYRSFLGDFCAWRKHSDPGFSQRTFARTAGIPANSSSLLPAIIRGRRNLSQALRVRFSSALKLPERDARYFDLLVQFNQAKDLGEKNFFFSQLSKFRTSKAHVLTEAQLEFLSNWHHSAIRNFIGMETRERNPAAIAARLFPQVSVQQVEDSLKLLLDLELIRKTANGYTLTDRHVSTTRDVRAEAARAHVPDLIGMAGSLLDKVPAEARQYNALMFAVSPQGFLAVKERIRSFLEEVREILDRDTGEDRLYALTLQLFPNSSLPETPVPGERK